MDCRYCGQSVRLMYMASKNAELTKHRLCFDCNFWRVVLDEDKEGRYVIGGVCYNACPEDSTSFRGHSGRSFTITPFGGQSFTTTNLWCRGEVPEHFRSRLPDNAVFGAVAQEKVS